MKRKIITCLTIVFIILISGYILFFTENSEVSPEKYIAEVAKNAKLIDKNIDHNQALDVAEYAQTQGITPPSILINFDTHSDIYVNKPISKTKGAQIEDWVNEYIAKNKNVDTVYWVMPKEEASSLKLRVEFGTLKEKEIAEGDAFYGNTLKFHNLRFLFIPLTLKNYTQKALINPNDGTMNEYVKGYKYNYLLFDKNIKYKKVKIITCTENTLPNLKNQDIFLSIDADYLSNSGYDTVEDFVIKKTPKQIDKTFTSIMKTLTQKEISPRIISMTLSPEYLPEEHHQHVQKLYDKVLQVAKTPDALSTYTRKNTHDEDEGGKSLRKDKN